MEQNKIQAEAKQVIDKFAKALEKVKEKDNKNFYIEREEFERIEERGEDCRDFKKKLLENAPKKNKDFIIAERGGWK